MEEIINSFLSSNIMSGILFCLRVIVPVLAMYVVWRSYTSFRKGQRLREPLLMLRTTDGTVDFPVLYWENSIGRSKSCDIVLPDEAASRDHAVLMRREEGWIICDTGSKSGVLVNGQKIDGKQTVSIGDELTMGLTTFVLMNAPGEQGRKRVRFTGFSKEAASPLKLMLVATLALFIMAVEGVFKEGGFSPEILIPFGLVALLGWGLFLLAVGILKHVSFEIETVAYLLSGTGIMLLAAEDISLVAAQISAMLLGMVIFSFLIWFMNDLERVMKFRLYIGIGAIALFALNMLIGTEINGSKNWIYIGPVSFQPSEVIKIAFVIFGASTLERLQTKKNITEFLIFTGICMAFLFLMRDFGTALIFFACFLIIAFMRSGSIRTIILVLAVAVLGAFMIIQFRPYVAERFSGWLHVWEHVNDNLGFQQTRALTYIASGGFFGIGLGGGCLKYVAAADADLVFAMLSEEEGIMLALVVIAAIGMFVLYARSDVTRSRSTFFSITACAVAGMLLFQTCLNVFGSTDVLPLTGVTLPFISAGGSSMMATWGLMAFLKASDERTYAARRAKG